MNERLKQKDYRMEIRYYLPSNTRNPYSLSSYSIIRPNSSNKANKNTFKKNKSRESLYSYKNTKNYCTKEKKTSFSVP